MPVDGQTPLTRSLPVRLPQPLGCLYALVLIVGALLLIGLLFPFLLIFAVLGFLFGIAG